jgi:hypothetical protein
MSIPRQLRELYRFPGFEPSAGVHGVFGDSWAVVLTLRRRGKKRCAAVVGKCRPAATISDHAACAISPVVIDAFTSTSSFAASAAHGVAP